MMNTTPTLNTEQATRQPRRIGAWLDRPRRWLGRHPRLRTAVAVLALLAVLADVYDAGRGAGAAAWQRAIDRVMEQQALAAATRPLPPLPAAVDKAAALQAFRGGAPYAFTIADNGILCHRRVMLPDGSMWELEANPSVGGSVLIRDRELEQGWQTAVGCSNVFIPTPGQPPLISSWAGRDGVCHHILRQADGHTREITPDFKLVTAPAVTGPTAPC
jgi:hypothetical protein